MKKHLLPVQTRLHKNLTIALLVIISTFLQFQTYAQGTWSPVATLAPDQNGGVMILLSDGTVMAKTFTGGADGYGNKWDRLTPNINGSYANGTWASNIAAMHSTRLYFSSQLLKDARLYVAGGEYGTGGSLGEVYDPLTNVWTSIPSTGQRISDANSEILPDGRVLQALVTSNLKINNIYDPATNTYSTGPSCIGIHNESAWVKLPDQSTLFVDRLTTASERYIPALNIWKADATVPVALYDPFGLETGGAVLLPNGKAFFIGSSGHTAFYTPSGTTANGVWTAGPDLPNAQGCPDAAAAMMVNGKVLLATSPVPTAANHFPAPTSYYEFNYLTNTFTRINAPSGALTDNVSCYLSNMLDLPNGQVLFCLQGSRQYYVYTPDGTPVASGKPTISNIARAGAGKYRITGTLFNGISEGATYGDDWQMNTNYPIVRLTSGTNVYYLRTFNWNRTDVATGSLPDTAFFTVPAGIPRGSYALDVSANGIASNPVIVPSAAFASDVAIASFTGSDAVIAKTDGFKVSPNPAKDQTTVYFTLDKTAQVSLKLYNVNGTAIRTLVSANLAQGNHSIPVSTRGLASGIYVVKMFTGSEIKNIKLLVQ